MVDAVAPPAHGIQRIAAGDEQVAGVEREVHIDVREESVDLGRRLHERARVVMERRLESCGANDGCRSLGVGQQPCPRGIGKRVDLGAAARRRTSRYGAVVGEGGQRQACGAELGSFGERSQRVVQGRQSCFEGFVVREGQLHPASGELEAVPAQARLKVRGSSEVADRTEVDAAVPGLREHREHVVRRDGLGTFGGHLEHAEAHRGAGDRRFHRSGSCPRSGRWEIRDDSYCSRARWVDVSVDTSGTGTSHQPSPLGE